MLRWVRVRKCNQILIFLVFDLPPRRRCDRIPVLKWLLLFMHFSARSYFVTALVVALLAFCIHEGDSDVQMLNHLIDAVQEIRKIQ